jgi:hypothetical protein
MKHTAYERGELLLIEGAIVNEGHDSHELVDLLGITVEDILERFGDRLLENRELFLEAHVQVDPIEEDEDETSEGSW